MSFKTSLLLFGLFGLISSFSRFEQVRCVHTFEEDIKSHQFKKQLARLLHDHYKELNSQSEHMFALQEDYRLMPSYKLLIAQRRLGRSSIASISRVLRKCFRINRLQRVLRPINELHSVRLELTKKVESLLYEKICQRCKTEAQPKAFSFASYYGSHMVLQKAPQKANIWGYALKSGEEVTITISPGSETVNVVSFIGPLPSVPVWSAQLPAVPAGGPHNITATSSEGTIQLTDVLFGDVWICSGQSNMQFTVSMGDNATAEIKDADNFPNIRVFTASLESAETEQSDLIGITEPWSIAGSESIGGKNWTYFSAVCWFYGKALYTNLQYPIGLVSSSYWGTRIESWSSPGVLAKCGDNLTVGADDTGSDWDDHRERADDIESDRDDHTETADDTGKDRIDQRERADDTGSDSDDDPGNSVLWNAMIRPFINMTIYGVIWYQGESNAIQSANMNKYNCTFPAMIEDWRSRFHLGSKKQTDPLFPFGFVQLGAWHDNQTITTGFPDIRWHQTADYGYVPNDRMKKVFMAVAMDLPDYNDPWTSIHPRDKQDMGVRLAQAGLVVGYNQSQYPRLSSPIATHFTIWEADNTLQIEYDSGNATLEIRSSDGFEVRCIYLGGSPGELTDWLSFPMTSHDNSSVTLDYSKICLQSKNMMVASFRYAWRESPCPFKKCAVYNRISGAPSPPFIKEIISDKRNVHMIKNDKFLNTLLNM